jgi:predicted short-subunit dehydrogenase-like oxidoreductase (DUF2520 family)
MKPDLVIIGPGKVGTTLAVLAARAGYRIVGMAGRSADRARAAAGMTGQNVVIAEPVKVAALGGLVLLTVPDDSIAAVCKQLAEAKAFPADCILAHCSGALSSEILAPARALCRARVGSLHPLQTFPDVQAGIDRFAGTYCFCEGDAQAVTELMVLAEELGGKPVEMSTQGKLLYHASAVLASNYLVGLMDAALATAGKAGIRGEDAAAALEPLVKATLMNIRNLGPAKALTGPIARGDWQLVERQYHDVRAADERLGDIYQAMGVWTVDVALRKGTIDQEKAEKLRKILT